MHFPIVIFQWLVTIADAIIYAVISFFGAIIIIIAFAMADIIKKQISIQGVLIALIDQPFVDTAHYKSLHTGFREGKQQLIVSVSEKGWEGVPALFDKCYFQELLNLKGEQGAKKLIQSTKKKVTKLNAGPLLVDMDTPEVYAALYKKINLRL